MPDKIPDRSTLNEEDFKAMMERIEASNVGQEKYAKKQYRMSQITALCSILVLIIVIYAAEMCIRDRPMALWMLPIRYSSFSSYFL